MHLTKYRRVDVIVVREGQNYFLFQVSCDRLLLFAFNKVHTHTPNSLQTIYPLACSFRPFFTVTHSGTQYQNTLKIVVRKFINYKWWIHWCIQRFQHDTLRPKLLPIHFICILFGRFAIQSMHVFGTLHDCFDCR